MAVTMFQEHIEAQMANPPPETARMTHVPSIVSRKGADNLTFYLLLNLVQLHYTTLCEGENLDIYTYLYIQSHILWLKHRSPSF